MDKWIKEVKLKVEVEQSILNAPIKDLNRIYYNMGLVVTKGKKGREKGLILLKNEIKGDVEDGIS